MQTTSIMVTDPGLSALVEQTRNRYGRAGLIALVELVRRELIQPGPGMENSLIVP